jgi:FXSXX-COOH protein
MRGHGELETELIDLTDCSLDELRTLDDDDLQFAVQRVLRQVEKPRTNLGSSGPPGRAD